MATSALGMSCSTHSLGASLALSVCFFTSFGGDYKPDIAFDADPPGKISC